MDLAEPTQVLTSSLDGVVLAVLARAGEGLTPGGVHRRSRRGSEPGVRRTLARLVGQGIVQATPAGNAVLYRLNREHLAAPLIEQLVDLRAALWTCLREHLAGWEVPAVHASVFGSAARGDGGPSSDIDLLVVEPVAGDTSPRGWEEQITDLREWVLRWTGNRAQILEFDEDELRQVVIRGERLIAEIRRDGITLAGPDLNSLVPSQLKRTRQKGSSR